MTNIDQVCDGITDEVLEAKDQKEGGRPCSQTKIRVANSETRKRTAVPSCKGRKWTNGQGIALKGTNFEGLRSVSELDVDMVSSKELQQSYLLTRMTCCAGGHAMDLGGSVFCFIYLSVQEEVNVYCSSMFITDQCELQYSVSISQANKCCPRVYLCHLI